MSSAARINVAAKELRLTRAAEMGPVYFHGETMRPFMGEGDLVVVEPVHWESIRVGDIITYRFDDKFPTRRVVSIDRRAGRMILRGDSIPGYRDYHVHRADVLGRATARIRNGHRLNAGTFEWQWAALRAVTTQRVALFLLASRRRMRGALSRLRRLVP